MTCARTVVPECAGYGETGKVRKGAEEDLEGVESNSKSERCNEDSTCFTGWKSGECLSGAEVRTNDPDVVISDEPEDAAASSRESVVDNRENSCELRIYQQVWSTSSESRPTVAFIHLFQGVRTS